MLKKFFQSTLHPNFYDPMTINITNYSYFKFIKIKGASKFTENLKIIEMDICTLEK